MKIGVISDTHDYLDPKIPAIFEGVEYILHGGDIGLPWIVFQLEQIAPVTAVLGNTDDSAIQFRQTELVVLANRKFLVHHIVDPRSPSDVVKQRLMRDNPDAVIFGHTHKPFNQMIAGILFFNPGYAGKQRFDLPRSVAILHCDKKEIRPEFFLL
jgi:uncharacterized protein